MYKIAKTMKYSMVVAAIIPILMLMTVPNAYAGGPDTADACYDLGYEQGQDKPFQRGNYDACERFRNAFGDREAYDGGKNPYYEGFIDGCKSVEGNTEEICERATD